MCTILHNKVINHTTYKTIKGYYFGSTICMPALCQTSLGAVYLCHPDDSMDGCTPSACVKNRTTSIVQWDSTSNIKTVLRSYAYTGTADQRHCAKVRNMVLCYRCFKFIFVFFYVGIFVIQLIEIMLISLF